jgi:hypothetical protein
LSAAYWEFRVIKMMTDVGRNIFSVMAILDEEGSKIHFSSGALKNYAPL